MIARLHSMLAGPPAVRPEVVTMFQTFLNRRIYPVVPALGSVRPASAYCAVNP